MSWFIDPLCRYTAECGFPLPTLGQGGPQQVATSSTSQDNHACGRDCDTTAGGAVSGNGTNATVGVVLTAAVCGALAAVSVMRFGGR